MSSHLGADEWEIENPRLVSICYQLIRANWVITAAAPVGLPDGRRWCISSLWDGRPLASLCVMVLAPRRPPTGTTAPTLAVLGRVYKSFSQPVQGQQGLLPVLQHQCLLLIVGPYGTLVHYGQPGQHSKRGDRQAEWSPWSCRVCCLPFSVHYEAPSSSLE